MAKSTAEKLLVKPGTTVFVWPTARLALIGALPDGVRVVDGMEAATAAVVFVDDAATLKAALEAHRDHLSQPALLWIGYPKGGRADINRDSMWPMLTPYGLRPITQIAIDDVWSALRFRPLAAGEGPFTGGAG